MVIFTPNREKSLKYLADCLPTLEYSVGSSSHTISFDTDIGEMYKTESKNSLENIRFYQFLVNKELLKRFIMNVLRYNERPFQNYGSVITRAFEWSRARPEERWSDVAYESYNYMKGINS